MLRFEHSIKTPQLNRKPNTMKSPSEAEDSRSQKIIYALKQLRQFQPAQTRERATHVLTGVLVEPLPDPDRQDHGLLLLTFCNGRTEAVIGEAYLRLQLIEHCRLEHDSAQGQGEIAQRVQQLTRKLGGLCGQD